MVAIATAPPRETKRPDRLTGSNPTLYIVYKTSRVPRALFTTRLEDTNKLVSTLLLAASERSAARTAGLRLYECEIRFHAALQMSSPFIWRIAGRTEGARAREVGTSGCPAGLARDYRIRTGVRFLALLTRRKRHISQIFRIAESLATRELKKKSRRNSAHFFADFYE